MNEARASGDASCRSPSRFQTSWLPDKQRDTYLDFIEELTREGIERLMLALEAFIDMIPQYEMPEINENGDIIIRRKRQEDPAPEADDGGDLDQTRT